MSGNTVHSSAIEQPAEAAAAGRPRMALPTHVTIEHTSSCNLQCFFCEHHSPDGPVKAGWMDADLLGKVENELVPAASTVSCTVSGEPFMDKRLVQIVAMAKKHPGKTLAVVTNGQLMDQRRLEVFAGLDLPLYVSVSLDTINPDVHKHLRRNSDFATVIGNVKRFNGTMRSLGVREAHLGLSSVLMTHTLPGIRDLVTFAADTGAETIGMAHLTVFAERDLPLSLFNHRAECNAVLSSAADQAEKSDIKLYRPPQFALSKREVETYRESPRPACPYLQGRVYINLDGEVEMCCRKGRPTTGNLYEQSFDSIWNGDVYDTYRRRYAAGDPMPICRSCFVIETYKPYLLDMEPFVLLEKAHSNAGAAAHGR